MNKKQQNGWVKYTDFIVMELLTVVASFLLAFLVRLNFEVFSTVKKEYILLLGIIALFNVLASCLFDAFEDVFSRSLFREIAISLRQVVIVFAGLTLYLFAVQESATYSRIILSLTFLFDFVLGIVLRMIYKNSKMARKMHAYRLMIVTRSDLVEQVLTEIQNKNCFPGGIVELAITDKDFTEKKFDGVPVVANSDTVAEFVRSKWIDEVLVVLPENSEVKAKLVQDFIKMGVTIHVNIDKMQGIPESRQTVESIGNISVITSSISNASTGKLFVKRLADIFFGLIGCVLTILVAIVIAPFILIKSPGHLIFVQKRVGKNGKYFKMLKFRSMVNNAEAEKKKLMDRNIVQDNLMFKLDFDPRVIGNKVLPDGTKKTGIGEFIRRTSIDELPQFFNVLKGDMSLVGTRPPTVDEYKKYSLHHRARLSVKPGITGMWQVSGRSDITDFEEVVKLDTEYIYNWSLSLDAKIIGRTVGVVLKRKGAK